MRRIDLILDNSALETFKENAFGLGISEFDVCEVRRWGAAHLERQRLYRGNSFVTDLVERAKVEFLVADEDVKAVVHWLLATVHPDSVSILKVDEIVMFDQRSAKARGLSSLQDRRVA